MELLLIRHGQTDGNKERRFIGGRTDEPVCEDGLKELRKKSYPAGCPVFSSPMFRCRQTAECIFGEKNPIIIENLRECDFGRLEGKTHQEMEADREYEEFVRSGGALPYPGGESLEAFYARCREGFAEVVEACRERGYEKAACVVHGGVIMALMSWLIPDGRQFYDWYVENGEGYSLLIDKGKWAKGEYRGTVKE